MKRNHIYHKRPIISFFVVLLSMGILNATNYYVDPATGNINNDGSLASPWSKLDTVFSSGKTFVAGDTIFLKSGDHGFPVINQSNSANVVITKYGSDDPIINRIDFDGASYWVIDNVRVYTTDTPPEGPVLVHPVPALINNSLIRVMNSTTHITFMNCFIYSIEDASSWNSNDWNEKAWNGMYVNSGCHNISIEKCHIKNVNFGIHLNENSEGNILRYTTIENFCGDGLRISENGIFEYNVIKDVIASNPGQHYDLIQGFRIESGAVIRGNMLISQTSDRDFSSACQGIGLFDGMFNNLIIENNLIACSNWHGLAIFGAKNCSIVNNTVVRCPYGSGNTPWITIENHKQGTASSGNIIKNNLTSNITSTLGSIVSNNIISTTYSAHFVDYAALDFHLKPFSVANNAGDTSIIPTHDLDEVERNSPCDIGCYEFVNNSSDQTSPDAVNGLDTTEVLFTSAEFIWNPSQEDNAMYRVYLNEIAISLLDDTTFSISDLTPNTEYAFAVSIVDSVGNESDPSGIIFTTPLTGLVVSTGSWQTIYVSSQKDTFNVTFDATPTLSSMDTYIGVLKGTPLVTKDLICAIYFNSSGQIQAKDGSNFSSDQVVDFVANTKYYFRLEIDVTTDTYDIYVTPDGGSEITIGEDYSFETPVDSLDSWTVRHFASKILEINDVRFTIPELPSNVTDKLFNSKIEIYPNPISTSDNIIITLSNKNNSSVVVKIYDITGSVLRNRKLPVNANKVTIPNSLNSGIYILSVEGVGFQKQQKLIVN